MEELWNCFSDGSTLETPSVTQEDSDSGEDLMAISMQALNGTEGSMTIRLRGFLARQEAFMLVEVPIVLSMSSWPLRYQVGKLYLLLFMLQ